MNKREVISAVASRSGVDPEDCIKVFDTFEDVFSEEITVFEYVYDILTRIKNKKDSGSNS